MCAGVCVASCLLRAVWLLVVFSLLQLLVVPSVFVLCCRTLFLLAAVAYDSKALRFRGYPKPLNP